MNDKDLDRLLHLLDEAKVDEMEASNKSSFDLTDQEWELFAMMENTLHDEAILMEAPKELQSSIMRQIMQEKKAKLAQTDLHFQKSLMGYLSITSLTMIISYFSGKSTSSIASKFVIPYDFYTKVGLDTASFYQKITETTIKFPPFVYMSIFAVLMVIGLELFVKSRSLVKQR